MLCSMAAIDSSILSTIYVLDQKEMIFYTFVTSILYFSYGGPDFPIFDYGHSNGGNIVVFFNFRE